MAQQDLHLSQTAGWRALLTHAQFEAGVQLTRAVEEHLVSLLFRSVGSELGAVDLEAGFIDRIERIMSADADDGAQVGDHCLLLAGLFPEQAIQKGVPVSCFVEIGRSAWREHALRHDCALHAILAREFVMAMDTLQTVRALQSGTPCIDAFNAFNLWHEVGSTHGWRVLRTLTAALPAGCPDADRLH